VSAGQGPAPLTQFAQTVPVLICKTTMLREKEINMCKHRESINCIVPPHILRAMAESSDPRVRESALRTLVTSARIRGQREVVGAVRNTFLVNPAGRKHRTIYDAGNQLLDDRELPGRLVRDEGQPASNDAASDEAYEGLGKTYDFYSEVVGRTSIDGRGMPLVGTVHYGSGFNNAFWNGRQMVFGDGDNVVFSSFTKSLDVIGHELTHGVTENTSGLEYHRQPGALNESFSDVFGSLVKQYAKRQSVTQADWLIGSEILARGINGVALRSMKDPGSAYDDPHFGGKDPQPKHMRGYVNLPDDRFDDWGGVHVNSGIPNYAFYLVATQLGGYAWEDAGGIWYQSLLQLHSTSQFQDCADITAQVAAAKFGTGSRQHQAVTTAWDEVGLGVSTPVAGASRARAARSGFEANGADLKNRIATLIEDLRNTAEAIPAGFRSSSGQRRGRE
jgi:Zn-dependent metalloprotease